MIGKKLGHYEILDLLGKGGMGEVYRARDERLGREVAIKVLPDEVAQNPEVRERFRREATTISSLNHPHICTLHDVGEADGVAFLVMELVEGETLDAMLARGPLPLPEVLRLGAQVADALDRAHRAGVIHRDLKPGNIMVTREGAKLLDFGLARATAEGGPVSDLTVAVSPTVAQPLTREGAILGTFQYMAPEQLEGKEVDRASDIWALGCVLYEMATGQRAFGGATQASLIGSIMHQEPEPMSRGAALAPAGFDRLVQACLRKDPRERLQSAHDLRVQLEWLAEGGEVAAAATITKAAWPLLAAVALVALLLGAAGAWLLGGRAGDPSADGHMRTSLGRWELRPTTSPLLAPDGQSVVLTLGDGTRSHLARRPLDSFSVQSIEGTDGAYAPFHSPDGRWLGFVTEDGIHRIPPGGGTPQLLARMSGINSADWGGDGYIYACPGGGDADGVALYRVPEDGGTPEPFGARLDQDETFAWLPEYLPGGSAILLSVSSDIVALAADGSRHVAVRDAFLGRYLEPGVLLYRDIASDAVAAIRFDPRTALTQGGAVVLTEPVNANFCYDASPLGQMAYVPLANGPDGEQLVWVAPEGEPELATELLGDWLQPRISPDGRRVLVRQGGNSCELWLLDLDRSSFSRVVQGGDNHDPLWGPDGRRILFSRTDTGALVVMDLRGSRELQVVAEGSDRGTPHSWSGVHDMLAYTVRGEGGKDDIWLRDMSGSGETRAFTTTPELERNPRFSPDGRWIAYTSLATGTPEICIRPYPEGNGVWQVSAGGGICPAWSRDGRAIHFLRPTDGALMASSIRADPDLVVGAPRQLLGPMLSTSTALGYDIGPDGRFITTRSTRSADPGVELRLLTNWPQLLRELRGEAE